MLSPGLRCTAEGLAHKVLSSLMASGQPPEDWQRETVILKSGPGVSPPLIVKSENVYAPVPGLR